MTEKIILDACCGGKHIWFNKQHPQACYMDIREVEKGTIKLQPNWCIKPDIIGDYTQMKFEDKTFKLVVWDLPHKLKKDNGLITMKYGYLGENWKENTLKGFNEIMRVLDDYGILVMKFSDVSISIREILSILPQQALFGTPTKKGVNNTYWFCFMKIPQNQFNKE